MLGQMKKIWTHKGIRVGIFMLWAYFMTLGSGKYGEPKLELSMQKIDLAAKEILVRLVVTNVGKFRLCLPRIREGMLKGHFEWRGWNPVIKEQHHAGGFAGHWWKRSRTMFTDFLSLAPGKQFAITINLAEMEQFPPDDAPPPTVITTPGKYEARVRLRLGVKRHIPALLFWKVWAGRVESNTITFVVEEPQAERLSLEDAQVSSQAEGERQNAPE